MSPEPAVPIPELVLRTPRLILRPIAEHDRDGFERAWRDSRDRLAPWLPQHWGTLTPAAAFDEYLRQQKWTADGGGFRRLVTLPDGSPVGTVNLSNIIRAPLCGAFAAWNLFTGHTGHGYATEAVDAVLTCAFTTLGLHRVQANIVPDNADSLRLAARLGFRREGYAIRYLEIAGRRRDHVMTAKLADEHEPRVRSTFGP